MQHSLKDDYANCVKNYTNQFKENSFRKLACNDFKSWPGPREETWRLSRLGTLSRKKIKPITPKGVVTLEIFKPLGLSHEASTLPTGSLNDLISAKVSHIPLILLLSKAKRSIKASSFLLSSAALISTWLAARMVSASL